ncbi:hypothetical protein HY464_00305 [Candidatus Peregrinibacteria bacterium]|nr:hypothetical protein [Candidatus Peregrinibacteria bacterium]MBI4129114.1 hypothetical protein [Candidatus Peregrinibacteria bacterium]
MKGRFAQAALKLAVRALVSPEYRLQDDLRSIIVVHHTIIPDTDAENGYRRIFLIIFITSFTGMPTVFPPFVKSTTVSQPSSGTFALIFMIMNEGFSILKRYILSTPHLNPLPMGEEDPSRLRSSHSHVPLLLDAAIEGTCF